MSTKTKTKAKLGIGRIVAGYSPRARAVIAVCGDRTGYGLTTAHAVLSIAIGGGAAWGRA